MGWHSILQGIFPTQGSNPGLLHRRQILYHLSHLGGSKVSVAQDNILVSFTSKSFTWGLLLPRGGTPFARGWARQAEEQEMGAGQYLFFSHVLERRFCSCRVVSNLPDQGSNPGPLRWEYGVLGTARPGES